MGKLGGSHRDCGLGCNHLTDFEEWKLNLRGLDPAHLVSIEAIATGAELETLCRAGMPRYWADNGAVLIHPREVVDWMLSGTFRHLLMEREVPAWAEGAWPPMPDFKKEG